MILSCFLQTCIITQNKVTQTVNAGVLHQYSLSWVMLFGSVMAVKPLQRYLDGKKKYTQTTQKTQHTKTRQ